MPISLSFSFSHSSTHRGDEDGTARVNGSRVEEFVELLQFVHLTEGSREGGDFGKYEEMRTEEEGRKSIFLIL